MRQLSLTLMFFAAASAACASSTVYITFTNLNADVQGNGTTNNQSTTYNGETNATIAGIPNEVLICDDFSNVTDVPSGAIDFSVNTISSLTATDVAFSKNFVQGLNGEAGGGMSQIQAYETVAVLTSDLEAAGNTGQQITDYQYAIWDLMEPNGVDGNNSSIKDSPLDSNAAADLQTAFSAVIASSPTAATTKAENSLVIYTPAAGYTSNQEFVGLNTPTQTPEPSTWLLMAGFGFLFCLPQVRARLRAASSRS